MIINSLLLNRRRFLEVWHIATRMVKLPLTTFVMAKVTILAVLIVIMMNLVVQKLLILVLGVLMKLILVSMVLILVPAIPIKPISVLIILVRIDPMIAIKNVLKMLIVLSRKRLPQQRGPKRSPTKIASQGRPSTR